MFIEINRIQKKYFTLLELACKMISFNILNKHFCATYIGTVIMLPYWLFFGTSLSAVWRTTLDRASWTNGAQVQNCCSFLVLCPTTGGGTRRDAQTLCRDYYPSAGRLKHADSAGLPGLPGPSCCRVGRNRWMLQARFSTKSSFTAFSSCCWIISPCMQRLLVTH